MSLSVIFDIPTDYSHMLVTEVRSKEGSTTAVLPIEGTDGNLSRVYSEVLYEEDIDYLLGYAAAFTRIYSLGKRIV